MDSAIFVCGMAPLDPDDPSFDLFLCDPSLDSDTQNEADFYTSKIELERAELYCDCACEFDSSVEMNDDSYIGRPLFCSAPCLQGEP